MTSSRLDFTENRVYILFDLISGLISSSPQKLVLLLFYGLFLYCCTKLWVEVLQYEAIDINVF